MSKSSITSVKEESIVFPNDHIIHKVPALAGGIGLIGLGLAGAMFFSMENKALFFGSYLVSFLFFLTLALGGMSFVLIHYCTRAAWSTVVRRLAENIMGTIPLMVLLFLPLLFGLNHVYEWIPYPELVKTKAAYLNKSFFLTRVGIYFAIWLGIAWYFGSKSLEQDETGDHQITRTLQKWSPVGIAGFALSLTFAAFDWIMSIDPHWFSTIFGVYLFAGTTLALHSFLAVYVIGLRKTGMLNGVVTTEHDHDIGKMMFAFTVFWTYIAFSQFMLIWYANIPEETGWYAYRLGKDWGTFTQALALSHFLIPFFYLMSRHIKRNPFTLFIGAIWLLAVHVVDLYWLIMPTIYHNLAYVPGSHHTVKAAKAIHFEVSHLLPLVCCLVGMGGLFIAGVALRAKQSALIPRKDPRLAESLAHENF